MNTRDSNDTIENKVPDPHPCSYDPKNIQDSDKDYELISNCCQRHVCRLNGYCKSKKTNKCRFGYPYAIESKTRIEFIETNNNVRDEIYLKRNDPYMNMHNRVKYKLKINLTVLLSSLLIFKTLCHYWRGNVDLQIVLDKQAAISYMVKYATKGEKAGVEYNKLYNDVISACDDDANPQTKMRSLMMKQVAGKRDLGEYQPKV